MWCRYADTCQCKSMTVHFHWLIHLPLVAQFGMSARVKCKWCRRECDVMFQSILNGYGGNESFFELVGPCVSKRRIGLFQLEIIGLIPIDFIPVSIEQGNYIPVVSRGRFGM